jgi:hypothetical protein
MGACFFLQETKVTPQIEQTTMPNVILFMRDINLIGFAINKLCCPWPFAGPPCWIVPGIRRLGN